MDPLSMNASISGLISILGVIAGRSYKYVKSAKRSVQEVKKLVDEMTNLYGILNQLRLVVSRFDDESISSVTQSQHIDACRTLLDTIKERLDKADPSHLKSQKQALTRKISTLGRALSWPFSVSETKALIDDIRTQKSTFILGLQVDEMNILLDALGDRKPRGLEIEAIRANVLALRNERSMSMLNKKQKETIKWIAPYDPTKGPSGSSKETNSTTGVIRKHQGCGCMVFVGISEIAKPSHGTPLMGACYFGRYEMVALLLKAGARTTCKKADGAELTAVVKARHHPRIEERGFEALDEPKPARVTNVSMVEECVKRIAEDKEKNDDDEKENQVEGLKAI